jgi:hypothetical protein
MKAQKEEEEEEEDITLREDTNVQRGAYFFSDKLPTSCIYRVRNKSVYTFITGRSSVISGPIL